MKEYNFYYDESEHSRRINHNTITADNYYDSFVSVIVGWRSEDESDLLRRYAEFEEKYKHRKSKGELKSTTIKQKQLKYGFASLNEDNINLLGDYLSLFDEKTLIYYSIISKVEFIISQLFVDYKNSLFVDMDAMKYSIAKALVLYQPKEVMEGLYENTEQLVVLLKNFFRDQINKNKANKSLKRKEIESFTEILELLNEVSLIRTINWNYDISFIGFKKYLSEKDIGDYSLTIDKEGEGENTAKAAERIGLLAVSEGDSIITEGLRMADMLAGLISKLLKALHSALHFSLPDENVHKKILDKEWFMINEQQFSLYKKLYNILVEPNNAQYKAFSGVYADDMNALITYLKFMNRFEKLKHMKFDIEMQGEYFNTYACESLLNYYERMRNKVPIEPIIDTSKEYVLNKRGAKVYNDINNQPKLEFEKSSILCNVLSVGFSREGIPLVTIEEEKDIRCYRLPHDLVEWAVTLVGFANMGENMFPSKVRFSHRKGDSYADIL